MRDVYICDGTRTPIGRYGGGLSSIRTDDLAAIPIRALIERNDSIDWTQSDDVILGCANQAGEDNRNVARMALLLAGLPEQVPGVTVNRLCASGLDAIATAARTIATGEANLVIAGGVESMSRAPWVMGKPKDAFSRAPEVFDTTLGWRFVNPKLQQEYGVDSMAETAENLADERKISREDQDRFALWSQTKAADAQQAGHLSGEITPVAVPQRKGDPITFDTDEHPRLSSLEQLAKLRTPFRDPGTVTAGNASGINDGAAALLLASQQAVEQFSLQPQARYLGAAVAGVPPRIMGIGPVPATQKLLARLGLQLSEFDIIELNEAFAVQSLACTRELGLADDDPRVNPWGGAIALGHPLGMSGARLALTALRQLHTSNHTRALCTMCVGVGQGMALALERCG
ncbi:MAG: 3-oxoadipyl-CoA thiolase [Pirellulales bacterium]|nr:3-oxoadipyl-CoA thiolase [Pirellulales bacterium]